MSLHTVGPLWFAALPGLLAFGLWAVNDLQRFVLLVIPAAMILPKALVQPGGSQVALADLLLLAALLIWLVSGSVRAVPGPFLAGNRLLLPALVFVAVNAVSLLWSVDKSTTMQFTIQMLEIVVIFPLVFASVPRSADVIRAGFVVFVVATGVLALITFVSFAPRAAAGTLEGRGFTNGLNKNVVGSFVGAGFVVAYTFCVAAGSRRTRWLWGAAAVAELAGLVATVSRGSIIGALVAVLTAGLVLRRRRLLTAGAVAVIALVYLGTIGAHSNVDRSQSGSYDSSIVRKYSFHNAIEKIRDRPLVGTGGGTYDDYIAQLQASLPDPNNMFLLTWAELGIAGVLSLIFLLGTFVRLLVSARRLPDVYAVPAVAAGGVTLSLFVHFQFDVTWTRGTSSLAFAMMGLMVAAERLAAAHAVVAPAEVPAPLDREPDGSPVVVPT